MTFKLFFPKQGDDGAYTGLVEEHEVFDAVVEEVRTSISEMGSDAYDLDLPEWPWTASNGVTYHSTEEVEKDTGAHEEWVMAGHERGIDNAVTFWAPQIFHELWVRYRSTPGGERDTAVDNTTYSKLPNGTMIALGEDD